MDLSLDITSRGKCFLSHSSDCCLDCGTPSNKSFYYYNFLREVGSSFYVLYFLPLPLNSEPFGELLCSLWSIANTYVDLPTQNAR